MKYKALRFDTIFDLKDFLNANEIPPRYIINISLKVVSNAYGIYELLYLEDDEE